MNQEPPKKLYRSKEGAMMFGVCQGLADYFDMDASIMRLIFVALTLAGFAGVLAYVIFAIVLPLRPY